MAFAVRGVIEGFYGRPWTWEERARMIDFLGAQGYNLYAYAPKSDPIHRDRWREPYLPEELEQFAALAGRCARQGIEFVFGISPKQFHYTDAVDFRTLWQKLLPVWDLGVRSFALLLDDMPDKFHHPDDEAKFGSIARAQAWLNNVLLAQFKGLGSPEGMGAGAAPCALRRLIFCPTEYCGDGVSSYLQTLGEELSPEIDLFWTGTEVCAQYLRTEEARKVAATVQRPVLYWDNYPVNDGAMQFRPHLRPIRGRDADLGDACRGIVANAALQPEACKIPLYTYARFMEDPASYEPEAAWQQALQVVTGDPNDAAAVAVLGDLTRWSAPERGRALYNTLAPKLDRFWRRWGGVPGTAGPDLKDAPVGSDTIAVAVAVASAADEPAPGTRQARELAVSDLAAEAERLQRAADRLAGPMANPYLQADLKPWTEKLQAELATFRAALAVVRAVVANPEDETIPALRRQVQDWLQVAQRNPHWVAGDLVDQFARRCLWAAWGL